MMISSNQRKSKILEQFYKVRSERSAINEILCPHCKHISSFFSPGMCLVCKNKHCNVPHLRADIFIQLLILLDRVTVCRLLSDRINYRKKKQGKVTALNVAFETVWILNWVCPSYYNIMMLCRRVAFIVKHLEDVRVWI